MNNSEQTGAQQTGGLRHALRRLRHSERGQGLVEYALIIVVVSLGAIASLTFLRDEIRNLFSRAGSSLAIGAGPSGGTTGTTGTTGAPAAPTGGSVSIVGLQGSLGDGDTLQATTPATGGGTVWTGTVTSYTYQWQRSGTTGNDCSTPRNFASYGAPVTTASTTNNMVTEVNGNDYCYRVVVTANNGAASSAAVTSAELEAE